MTLAGQGYDVHLAFLPYFDWAEDPSIVLIYAGRIFTHTLCWNLPEISYIPCHYWHKKTIKHSLVNY